MLQRSSVQASDSDLSAYYEELKQYHAAPLWTVPTSGAAYEEPHTKMLPHVWRWADMRPQLMRAAELVGTQEAERRVLRMVNPAPGSTAMTSAILGNFQIVMPGEVARAHRHTAAALRMIIESGGGYTVVNGEAIPMLPGDLVLTPNWTWHDHANDTDGPMIWLDGLDSPMVNMLEASFREEYPQETQAFGEEMDVSNVRYGSGGLRPAWGETPSAPHSPLMHYPWLQTKATLDRLAQSEAGSPHDGVIMEYTNPVTGGPVMPTIACYVQVLKPRQHTTAHRHLGSTIYHVIGGEGASFVGGTRLAWGDKDSFCVPSWTPHEHVNESATQPAYLFSYSNAPVLKALGLWREDQG
jgi:gentisate 1,2-dioxygenase